MPDQPYSKIANPREHKSSNVEDSVIAILPFSFHDEFFLWEPRYLEQSAWTSHIPFAFWIMNAIKPDIFVELGTHYGTSYFAFCQAVAEADLHTRCFAIDTWQGDKHAGHYGGEVYDAVQNHNAANYAGFSSLIRSSFDDAVHQFTDRSIDMLHIDGLHTYEAVKSDFETWHQKLSEKAIVIFHDTNERRADFGVWRLFEELRETYPAFEFVHGHGLGILGVGDNLPNVAQAFFEHAGKHEFSKNLRKFFSQLGKNCVDRADLLNQKKRNSRLVALEQELGKKEQKCRTLEIHLKERLDEIGRLTKLLEETNTASATQKNLLTKLIGQILIKFCTDGDIGFLSNRSRLKRKVHRLEHSGFFDSDWYLENNPDVKSSGLNPANHYLEFGGKEGRLPIDISVKTDQK